jgi:arsenate reductase-like glutaredoxin family protein
MEQSWLENNKIKHDIIHVDLNPKAAQDMVEKTGQMGVPVTEITYDEGESEYIIGFDKPKLSQLLGIE